MCGIQTSLGTGPASQGHRLRARSSRQLHECSGHLGLCSGRLSMRGSGRGPSAHAVLAGTHQRPDPGAVSGAALGVLSQQHTSLFFLSERRQVKSVMKQARLFREKVSWKLEQLLHRAVRLAANRLGYNTGETTFAEGQTQ